MFILCSSPGETKDKEEAKRREGTKGIKVYRGRHGVEAWATNDMPREGRKRKQKKIHGYLMSDWAISGRDRETKLKLGSKVGRTKLIARGSSFER